MHEFQARRWARDRRAGMGTYVLIDGIGVAVAGAVLGELLIYFRRGSLIDAFQLFVVAIVGGALGLVLSWRRWETNEARFADYVTSNAACIHCGGKPSEHADWCPVVAGFSARAESVWSWVRRWLW